jgi:hypothetical protein
LLHELGCARMETQVLAELCQFFGVARLDVRLFQSQLLVAVYSGAPVMT